MRSLPSSLRAAMLAVMGAAACSAPAVAEHPGVADAPSAVAEPLSPSVATAGEELAFDVPEDAIGIVITVKGSPDTNVGIARLVSPSGAVVVDGYVPAGGDRALGLGSRGLGAIAVPMTNATATGPLEHGAWRLVVGGIVVAPDAPVDKSGASLPVGTPLTGELALTISFQRSPDGAFHGGALDLHVYVPDGLRVHDPGPVHPITAAEAPSDAAISRRIDLFYEELERLFGIGRGEVSFHPIDTRYLSATTGDARASLMAQATVASPHALHIVLANRLAYGGGADVDPSASGLLGYSVGLPGAANVPSTVRSSIAVALYEDQPASNDAVTILHEMGHFVGLMHSTDYDGTEDLLDDTPVCSAKATRCADEDNLMAPDGPIGRTAVSPSQVRIVRGSPIYRTLARP